MKLCRLLNFRIFYYTEILKCYGFILFNIFFCSFPFEIITLQVSVWACYRVLNVNKKFSLKHCNGLRKRVEHCFAKKKAKKHSYFCSHLRGNYIIRTIYEVRYPSKFAWKVFNLAYAAMVNTR